MAFLNFNQPQYIVKKPPIYENTAGQTNSQAPFPVFTTSFALVDSREHLQSCLLV